MLDLDNDIEEVQTVNSKGGRWFWTDTIELGEDLGSIGIDQIINVEQMKIIEISYHSREKVTNVISPLMDSVDLSEVALPGSSSTGEPSRAHLITNKERRGIEHERVERDS